MSIRSISNLIAVALCACCAGCASRDIVPQVIEVTGTKRLKQIPVMDERLFVDDSASKLQLRNELLTPADQRMEYLVRWSGATVQRVKFEFRQLNLPDKVAEQTFVATNQHAHTFEVRGDEFLKGGAVSAWRVSLWHGDQLLAEKRSALW